MSSLTQSHLLSIYGFGDNDIFIGGAEGTMLHFNGSEWTSMDTKGRWTVKKMWGHDREHLYAVCTDGKILHFNGTEWTPIFSGSIATLYAVDGDGSDQMFVAGDIGTILSLEWVPDE